ncbi:MAG: hypothetical protein J5757_06415 [Lachnospiraceae bacterium]|nr:hypothetical protein [Lachnospiraceae bacterium]
MFKNHKKLWIIVLIVVVLGVGGALSQQNKDKDKKPITDAQGQVEAGNTNSNTNTTQAAGGAGTAAAKPAKVKETITEQVLFDVDGVKVTAKEYIDDSIWGEGIKLLVENNSDKDMRVGCNALIVNNYMISDLFSCTVAAGKKANDNLYLSSSDLKAAGIDTVGQIEIYFYLSEASTYVNSKNLDVVTVKTSEFANMDTTPNDAGKELLNQDGVRIVGKFVDENSFWGASILLFIENKTGNKIVVHCDDLSINGFMVTGYFSSTLYDQKMAIDNITLLSTQLEENGITSVDEVELKFEISDAETYKTIFKTDPIKFSTK